MLPTFFLAGAAKAGTTSLHHYLGEHPGIFMSGVKEPHFFSWEDDGWPRWAVRDRDAYEALFADARPGQERGEASTWTLYSEGAPNRIAQDIPDARFIVLLRNPPDRAFSNWAFNFGRGYDAIDTFEEALAAEPDRIAEGSPWHHHYVRAGLYHDQVKRYVDRFGPKRVLVLLFEDLRADVEAVVERAYDFLGVEPSFRPAVETVHNKTYVPRSRWLHTFMWRANPVKSVFKTMIPSGVRARIGRQLRVRNRTAPSKMEGPTRQRLNDVFRDDVARLSELIGRDLSSVWLKPPAR